MKKITIIAALVTICGCLQSHAQETLLVNFWNHENGPERYTTASASDYQAEDSWVNLSADVNKVSYDNSVESGAISAFGMTGVTVANQGNWSWNTGNGSYSDTPILDSYFYDEVGGLGRTLTVTGFEEITAGAAVRFTVWGVGDSSGANTDFQLNYNGSSSAGETTDYDNGPLT